MNFLGNLLKFAGSAGLAQYLRDSAGQITGVASSGGPIPLKGSPTYGRFVFLGDSLTYQAQQLRAPSKYDGRVWWSTVITTIANVGGTAFLAFAAVEGNQPATAGGTLQTDGTGRMQWKSTGDSYGAYVDVTQGGWFYLPSGTSGYGILVAIKGASGVPASGSTTVTVTGNPEIWDYDLRGFATWVAGSLGDMFKDYQCWGMNFATTADILKFTPQVLANSDVEAVSILCGKNDAPATASAAATTIANIKSIIDLCRASARTVFVNDIYPSTTDTATIQKYYALVSTAIRDYCRGKQGVIFVSAFNRLINPNLSTVTGKTGAFVADAVHLAPFGAYLASIDLVASIRQRYPALSQARKAMLDVWDSTLLTGSFNANPTLRGTAGTVTAANGFTGTAPDGYTIGRSGSTQLCTTSFDAATDGGLDWYSFSLSGATAGDYSYILLNVSVPSGFNTGDYFRLTCEMQIGAITGNGLTTFLIYVGTNTNSQIAQLLATTTGANPNTFSTELPVLALKTEPQKYLGGASTFNMRIRIGCADAAATAKIGFREFRLEKCAGPIYP